MGYARYMAPMGMAGYGVTDVCHEDGCNESIDRGLAYLCGEEPGSIGEVGCGRWYCGEHLFMPLNRVQIISSGLCGRCIANQDDNDDHRT